MRHRTKKEVGAVKVKAVKRYSDIILKRVVDAGEELDVTEDRAKYLQDQGMVAIPGAKKHEALKQD